MGIDLSILAGFTGYTSTLLAGHAASRAAKAKAAADGTDGSAVKVDVKTPWDASGTTSSETSRLVAAMQATTLINAHDSSFDKVGVADDYKKLFALYKGLATLQTLANKAADEDTQGGLLAGLDRRFQSGYAEVLKYAGGLDLDTLSLLTGSKQSVAQSGAKVTRASAAFQTKTVVQGDAQAAMSGLENASPFTISVKRGANAASVTDVAIDLDVMGATPRNLGNVINFINAKLAAAGVQTRLERVDVTPPAPDDKTTPAKQYAVKINGYGSEAISFSADTSSTALYMANQGVGGGELRKLNVDGAVPATVYRNAIAAAGGDINVKQTVTDDAGNVFVLGTTNADQGSQLNQSSSDVMLRKYDSAGNLLWSKLLGSSVATDALALAVDSKGAAVIAGQIAGKLGAGAALGGKDSYVVKISATGEEVFARQIGSVLDDSATALTIGPDDAIYVGGQVKGKMTGAAGTIGGTDAYIMKFSDTGVRAYTRQFGSTGEDRVSGLAVDGNGDLVVASVEGGQGVVRKFATADATSVAVWTQNIGDLSSGGAIAGLAVENGKIYIAGSTANAGLTGGAGVITAHGEGQDGFVYRLDDAGTSASAGFMTFLGSDSADRINGIAVSNGRIFVAGDTKGTLPGAVATHANISNAFAAELDGAGALQWASQFGVTTGEGYGKGLAVDGAGASVLDVLGLPKGALNPQQTRTITAQTTARAGDNFSLQIGELTARKITIEAGETMTTLARKVNAVLGLAGKASVVSSSAGQSLKIEPREGTTITLKAGAGNLDALAGLGLTPGRFVKPSAEKDTAEATDTLPTYALGLKASYSLGSTANAVAARSSIETAMSAIRTAYRELTMDPATKKLLAEGSGEHKGKTGGVVPAYLQNQLSNYSAGLARLTGGSSSSSSA